MNPLFQMMQGMGNPGMNQMISQFNQFRQTFRGDPRQQVQNLLNSGRISQAQYNHAVQMANQLQHLINGK